MKNDDFISLMVQETLEMSTAQDRHLRLVSGQFNDHELVLKIRLDQHRKCFVIEQNNRKIEFPNNWGPFKNFQNDTITLNGQTDRYGLINVLSLYFGVTAQQVTFLLDHEDIKSTPSLRFAA